MSFRRVAVVGAGLIGGSVALRLQARGVDVVAVDPDAATRRRAAEAGLSVREAIGPDLANRDLVVLAGPLPTFATTMAALVEATPDAVVMDVGSVKGPVREEAERAGLGGQHVGAHPMWGLESSGFAHASPDLLVGVTWAVTRPAPPAAAVRVVEHLVDTFEAEVVVLDSAEHDRAVALASHAPHVLAHALLEALEDDAGPARFLTAGSFRDATRVAGTHPERTLNMLAHNASALGEVLDDLVARLGDYRRDLEHPGRLAERLEAVADRAHVVRRPDPTWAPCPDLAAVLAAPGATVVRAGPHGLESTPGEV